MFFYTILLKESGAYGGTCIPPLNEALRRTKMKQISENFEDIKSSDGVKHDTRNNWVTMMFATKYRYNCFLKQSHIDTCTVAFREFELIGFEFGELGFGGNHVHFMVNVPKRYSIMNAEIMLKSCSSLRIFEKHPGFRKRYPRGSFWSGYEHHESAGRKNFEEASAYVRNQEGHHKIKVIDNRQQKLNAFIALRDAPSPTLGGLGEEQGERGL